MLEENKIIVRQDTTKTDVVAYKFDELLLRRSAERTHSKHYRR